MRGRLRVGCGRYPSVHGARALRLSLRRKGAALGRRQLLRAPPRSPRSRCRWRTYWSTHSTGHHGVSRATGGATAVGTQEVGMRAHISCSIWRCPRTPGAFYLQARSATHLATRYHVGADEVGEVRGRSLPRLPCELQVAPLHRAPSALVFFHRNARRDDWRRSSHVRLRTPQFQYCFVEIRRVTRLRTVRRFAVSSWDPGSQ